MKQTKKLGRGLEDFSHLFLSTPDEGGEPAAVPPVQDRPAEKTVAVHTRTVCIAGERGAGEKAFLAVKLARTLAAQGKKVVVFDADFSVPRLCMLMENVPSNSLLNLIAHPGARLQEQGGMTLITLDVDVATLGFLTGGERRSLVAAVDAGLDEAAVALVLTSGDCINQVRVFVESADDIAVVAPRPVAEMISAYGVIKKIFLLAHQSRVGIVASRNNGSEQADAAFEKMQRVVSKFLHRQILNYGYLPDDTSISGFLGRGGCAAAAAPSPETDRCLDGIARSLLAGEVRSPAHACQDHRPTLAEKLFSCAAPYAP